jgi:hypothetical protein
MEGGSAIPIPDVGAPAQAATRLMGEVVRALEAAGSTLALGRLQLVLLRDPVRTTVAASRPPALVVAGLDAKRATARVEQALTAWYQGAPSPVPASSPSAPPHHPPPLPPLAGREPAFSGRLSVFPVPDLLEFLRSARRTGVLRFSADAGTGMLRFNDGWITAGSSPATPSTGALVTRDETQGLADVVRQQIHLAVREMFHWRDGEFAFSGEDQTAVDAFVGAPRVDAQALLLDLFRELDEGSPGPVGPH